MWSKDGVYKCQSRCQGLSKHKKPAYFIQQEMVRTIKKGNAPSFVVNFGYFHLNYLCVQAHLKSNFDHMLELKSGALPILEQVQKIMLEHLEIPADLYESLCPIDIKLVNDIGIIPK